MSCLEKSLYFGQIQFVIWTNAFLILNIYIYTLDKYRPVLNTGQRNLCDWDYESGWGLGPRRHSPPPTSDPVSPILHIFLAVFVFYFVFVFQSVFVFVSLYIFLVTPLINISFLLFWPKHPSQTFSPTPNLNMAIFG